MFFSQWLPFPFLLHMSCSVTVAQVPLVPVEINILQSRQNSCCLLVGKCGIVLSGRSAFRFYISSLVKEKTLIYQLALRLSTIEEEPLCLCRIISWPVCLCPQSHSSQGSDRQSLACLQSDSSNSSTQVTKADRHPLDEAPASQGKTLGYPQFCVWLKQSIRSSQFRRSPFPPPAQP